LATVAHWNVCPNCGKHASLVYADGTESSAVISKEAAHLLVEASFSMGRIKEGELSRLHEEVGSFKLKENLSVIDLRVPTKMVEIALRLITACSKPAGDFQMAN
jgi:hypothetical protein